MQYYSFGKIIFSLIVTAAICSFPIIIYRYSILKHPVNRTVAKRITILYGTISFLLMTALLIFLTGDGKVGGAILVWSYINYRMLIGGKQINTAINAIDQSSLDSPSDEKASIYTGSSSKDTTVVIKISRQKKARKKAFCKRCGSLIDNKTRKCTGCGKQYFRLSKAIAWGILSIILICLLGYNAYQFYQIKQLNSENKDLMEKLETKSSYITELNSRIGNLQLKANFLDNNVVIVWDDGTKLYHKYGCTHRDIFKTTTFWAYNIEAAKQLGYRPCPYCCGS